MGREEVIGGEEKGQPESFFSSLKREELYRKKYRSESELYKAIDAYMEFYNARRPHAKLQYKTPDQKSRNLPCVAMGNEAMYVDCGCSDSLLFDLLFLEFSFFDILVR